MTEGEFRNKITWFSFVFSLLVVWVHSYNAELFLPLMPEMADVYYAEHFVGDRIGQIAVPGFFMISGYLFYRNFDWWKLREKWQKRISSVLVPFITWNFIYYLGYVIGSRLPWMTDVVGKGIIPLSLTAAVDAIINYTYNYVFWYLYQLILLILLAPILYPILRRTWSRILFWAILWSMLLWGRQTPWVNLDALIYYSFAGGLALDRKLGMRIVEGNATRKKLLAGGVYLVCGGLIFQLGLRLAFVPFFVASRLLMVGGLWLLVPGEKLPATKPFMNYNFFLYATHFAFVRLINKGVAELFLLPASGVVTLYLIMPFLVLGISTMAGSVLRRRVPVVWRVLNGGR